jgi:hypothetical protein
MPETTAQQFAREIGRILHIDDQNAGAAPAIGNEIGGFGLLLFQDRRITLNPSFFAAAFPASTGNETLTRNRMNLPP